MGIRRPRFLQRRFCIVSECPGVDQFCQHKRVSRYQSTTDLNFRIARHSGAILKDDHNRLRSSLSSFEKSLGGNLISKLRRWKSAVCQASTISANSRLSGQSGLPPEWEATKSFVPKYDSHLDRNWKCGLGGDAISSARTSRFALFTWLRIVGRHPSKRIRERKV